MATAGSGENEFHFHCLTAERRPSFIFTLHIFMCLHFQGNGRFPFQSSQCKRPCSSNRSFSSRLLSQPCLASGLKSSLQWCFSWDEAAAPAAEWEGGQSPAWWSSSGPGSPGGAVAEQLGNGHVHLGLPRTLPGTGPWMKAPQSQ